MKTTIHTIDTPLGRIKIGVVGLYESEFRIDLIKPEIKIPPGMSVDDVVVALVNIAPSRTTTGVRCECVWDQPPSKGDPESGECLDAQTWGNTCHRVTIGTEDYEALSHRLPELGFTEQNYPVTYADGGLIIEIPEARRDSRFSLHFVVAWRSLPDPADCSTWFAVDIPHAKIEIANKRLECND